MTTAPKPRPARSGQGAETIGRREAREAQALRANLARRKLQARGRDAAEEKSSPDKDR